MFVCVCVCFFFWSLFAFDRTLPIYVVFHSRGCWSRMLALAAILDCVTPLALMSCRYRSEARQDELRSSKVWGYDHIWRGCSANKNTQIPVIKQQRNLLAVFFLRYLPRDPQVSLLARVLECFWQLKTRQKLSKKQTDRNFLFGLFSEYINLGVVLPPYCWESPIVKWG